MKQLMKNLIRILTVALGCAATLSAHAKLNVVTTLPDLGALAREIGGDKVEVTTLAKATEDPHFVDARPSFVVQLRNVDVGKNARWTIWDLNIEICTRKP